MATIEGVGILYFLSREGSLFNVAEVLVTERDHLGDQKYRQRDLVTLQSRLTSGAWGERQWHLLRNFEPVGPHWGCSREEAIKKAKAYARRLMRERQAELG